MAYKEWHQLLKNTLTTTNGTVAVSSAWGSNELHYGTSSTPGISFSRTISVSSGFSGSTAYWKVINSTTREMQKNDNVWMTLTASSVLDTNLPYSANAQTSDSPGNGLSSAYKKVTVSDSFTMFLMFKPTVSDSIWVPLRSVNWSWTGEASKDSQGQWSLDASSKNTGNSSETSTHPTWSGNITS